MSLTYLKRMLKYNQSRVEVLRKQANAPHQEIAEHLNDASVLGWTISMIEAVDETAVAPTETSLTSEKKRWGKKRAEEVAAQTPPAEA